MKWLRGALAGVAFLFVIRSVDSHLFPEDKVKNKWTWLLSFCLLGLLLGILGCTRVVYRESPTPYVVVPDTVFAPCGLTEPCTIATAYCSEDNRPVIFIRKGYVRDEQKQFTRAHEEVHISQMSADCKGTSKRYQDSVEVRRRMEEAAYCAEAKARMKAGHSTEMVVSWFGQMMFALFETNRLVCELSP